MTTTLLERKTLPCAWKIDTAGSLVGYASTFGNVDKGGDVVAPGAFTATIENDIRTGGIPLLADHVASVRAVLGTIHDAIEDGTGLQIKATFATTPLAQDTRRLLLEGHLSKLSIGYEPVESHPATIGGQYVRVLDTIRLWETSVVVFPMNEHATVSHTKHAHTDSKIIFALDVDLALAEQQLLQTLLEI